jgi:hypothetical protein
MVKIEDPETGLSALEKRGASSITEEHGRGAVEWIDNRAHQIGPHYDDPLVCARGN